MFAKMKSISQISVILVALSPLTSAADEVKILTTVLTVPDGINLPGSVRTVTMRERQEIIRSLAQIKSVSLFTTPSATTSSGKMNSQLWFTGNNLNLRARQKY